MARLVYILIVTSLLVSCATPVATPTSTTTSLPGHNAAPYQSQSLVGNSEQVKNIPAFEHIVLILMENQGFNSVIGNPEMPVFNRLAQDNTLLTEFYAVEHPSLPNYIALVSGDTFGITSDCTDCFIDAPSLPDLIEASGRTWKTYQESMPKPCYLGNNIFAKFFKNRYAQKHNPFVYFDSIRFDQTRCERSVVPLQQLGKDIQANTLPNYIFITPDMCNNSHDCSLAIADTWLGKLLDTLVPALDATGQPYLVVLTFDEGKGEQPSSNLKDAGGGRIPVVLLSPSVKNGFQDDTPYTHYSLLKTISASWKLDYLGHAADENNVLITAPWK